MSLKEKISQKLYYLKLKAGPEVYDPERPGVSRRTLYDGETPVAIRTIICLAPSGNIITQITYLDEKCPKN